MAAGHGGQIPLAESRASLLSGVDLINLGRECGMYRCRSGCLKYGQRDFARSFRRCGRSIRLREILRPATTSLIGRAFRSHRDRSGGQGARLMTLTGVGGVDKTRLAVEAGRLADEFRDDVWFFELAAVQSGSAERGSWAYQRVDHRGQRVLHRMSLPESRWMLTAQPPIAELLRRHHARPA